MSADYSIPPAGQLMVARDMFKRLHLSDSGGYELIRLGKFPVPLERIGGRWMGRSGDFRALVGLPPTDAPELEPAEDCRS